MERLPVDIDPLSGPPGITTNANMLEAASAPARSVQSSESPGIRGRTVQGLGQATTLGGSSSQTAPSAPILIASGGLQTAQTTQTSSLTSLNGVSRPSVHGGPQMISQGPTVQRDHPTPPLQSDTPTQTQAASLSHPQGSCATPQQPTTPQPSSQSGGTRDGRAKQQSARRCAINFLKIYYRTLSANSKDLLRYYDLNACVDRISYGEFQNDEVTGIALQSVRSLLRNFGSVNRVTIKLIDYQYSSDDNVLISVEGSMQFAEAINPSNIACTNVNKPSSMVGNASAQTVPPNTDIDFLQIFYLTKNSKGWWVIQNDIFRFMSGSPAPICLQQTFVPIAQPMDTMPVNVHPVLNDPSRLNNGSSPLPNSMHGFSPSMHPVGTTQSMPRTQEMIIPTIVPPVRNPQPINQQTMLGSDYPTNDVQYIRPPVMSGMPNDRLFGGMGAPQVRNTNVSAPMTSGVDPNISRSSPGHVPHVTHSTGASANPSVLRPNANIVPGLVGAIANGLGNPPPARRPSRHGSGGPMPFYPNAAGSPHGRQTHVRPVSSHGPPGNYGRSSGPYDGPSEFRSRPRSGPQYFGSNRKHPRSSENGIFIKMSAELNEDDIRDGCSQFGEIENVEIRLEKRFAFVFFKTTEGMESAVDAGRFFAQGAENMIQKKKPYTGPHTQRFNSDSHPASRRGNRTSRGSYDSRPSSKSRSRGEKSYGRDSRESRQPDKRDVRMDGERPRKPSKSRHTASGSHSAQTNSNSSTHGPSPKKTNKKKKNQPGRAKYGDETSFVENAESGQKENINSENVKSLTHETGAQPKLLLSDRDAESITRSDH